MRKLIGCIVVLLVAGILVVGCGQEKSNEIVVGTKGYTESLILGEIVKQLVEENLDISVKTVKMDGGTAMLHPAIVEGEIDLYPEYSGTGLLYVLDGDLISDGDECFAKVKADYLDKFNLHWLDPYGFNNTYCLAVMEEYAMENDLVTYSDLAQAEGVRLGAEHDFFERPDGYDAMAETYDYDFEKVELAIGLKYEAINAGEVDVINAFATDGLLMAYNLMVLEDNQNFFPPYHCANVVRAEILDEYPELEKLLNNMGGLIDDKKMVELNYLADVEEIEPADVARDFLLEEGLIE